MVITKTLFIKVLKLNPILLNVLLAGLLLLHVTCSYPTALLGNLIEGLFHVFHKYFILGYLNQSTLVFLMIWPS